MRNLRRLAPTLPFVIAIVFAPACATTASDANKALVREYYERVVGTGDVADIASFIAADYTEVYRGDRYDLGVEGATEHVLGVRRAFPDLTIVVERQIAEGEWVVSSVVARGTHSAAWLGMAPTGERVEFTAVNVDRVVGGRIVEHGGAANLLAPLLESGAIRVSTRAAPRDE